ncbi:MAG: sigma-70 family RNA polymerase sigma factor [Candidatus Dadabacteria bacterium]
MSSVERNLRWQGYLSEIAQGRESALSALYDESKGLVYTFALKILDNQSDAEEIALDVYKYVWNNAANYNAELSNPSTWLIMLTRSRSIDKNRARKDTQELSDIIEKEISSSEKSTEKAALESEQRKIILEALSELDPNHRRVLELAYFYQYTQSEISEMMGIPLGSVKSIVRLATDKLKKTLEIIK